MVKHKYALAAELAAAPRIAAALQRDGVEYMGPCVVQAPGAWTRVGPTWLVPHVGWVTFGLGVRSWGTSAGLAELAARATAKPTWHAAGISVVPAPNVVYAVQREALEAPHMADVASLAQQADSL